MKRKTRRILFYSSIVIFFVISAIVVLYALGYQYDFVQGQFFKIGSFDVKTNVSAQVYVNDVFAGSTSFLGNYFSQSRLLPRVYSVRVQADNYQPWQKLVKVNAGFLTSFPKVILLPKTFQENTVASASFKTVTITRFDVANGTALVGNKQKVEAINLKTGEITPVKLPLLPEKNAAKLNVLVRNNIAGVTSPDGVVTAGFYNNEIWVQWLKDSSYQPFKKAGNSLLVTRFPQTINDIQWYKDSDHLLVSVGGILKLIEIDDRDGINVFDITTLSGPFYYDRSSDLIYKFEGNKLVKISIK